MIPAFLVFLGVTCAIVAGYFALSLLPGILAERRLDRRLRDVSTDSSPVADADKEGSDDSILMRKLEGPLPGMDRLMSGTGLGKRMARLIDQSGVRTTPSAIGLISLVAAAIVGVIVFLLTPQPFAPLVGAVIAGASPVCFLMHKRSSRLKKFEEQFPEALDLLARAIRAGHALQTALGMAAEELPEPVGPEFKKTFDQQNFGLPLRDALNEMAARIGLLDVRFFVTAVLIQRDTGGNLSEILENLANVVRERFKIRRQVRVHTAHGRFTGFVLLALPAALGIALSVINPEHMQVLFRERVGQLMLTGAIVMQTIGFIWIRQVIKIEV
jgi:tight adherence protein B